MRGGEEEEVEEAKRRELMHPTVIPGANELGEGVRTTTGNMQQRTENTESRNKNRESERGRERERERERERDVYTSIYISVLEPRARFARA